MKRPAKVPNGVRPNTFVRWVLALVLGTASGIAITVMLGRDLQISDPKVVDGIARVQRIRTGKNLRELRSVASFEVKLSNVDDRARVYVNNYLVAMQSGPLFYTAFSGGESTRNNFLENARSVPNPSAAADVRGQLKRGRNIMIIEVENSHWGPCSARVDVLINGSNADGFPVFVPEYRDVDSIMQPKKFREKYLGLVSPVPELLPRARDSALCIRLAYTLDLL